MADGTPRTASFLQHDRTTALCRVCGTLVAILGAGIFRAGVRVGLHHVDGARCDGSYSRVQNPADPGGAR